LALGRLPRACFRRGLELGAGDGWSAGLLGEWVQHLVCTDYYPAILDNRPTAGLEYRVLNAEAVGDAFPPGAFDLVFSAHLLEHIDDIDRALSGVRAVLADDGITIHVMPNPVWKLSQVCCYTPSLARAAFQEVLAHRSVPRLLQRIGRCGERRDSDAATEWHFTPTPEEFRPQGRRGFASRLLLPEIHGVSPTHLAELSAFAKASWLARFHRSGFEIVEVMPGIVSSGYSFGLDPIRRMLEALGFSSEYIYVAIKAGHASRFARYFGARTPAPHRPAQGRDSPHQA